MPLSNSDVSLLTGFLNTGSVYLFEQLMSVLHHMTASMVDTADRWVNWQQWMLLAPSGSFIYLRRRQSDAECLTWFKSPVAHWQWVPLPRLVSLV